MFKATILIHILLEKCCLIVHLHYVSPHFYSQLYNLKCSTEVLLSLTVYQVVSSFLSKAAVNWLKKGFR